MAFVRCLVAIWFIYFALTLIGYEFHWILRRTNFFKSSLVEVNALTGLAVVQFICWYRLSFLGGGIGSTLDLLISLFLIVGIVLGIVNLRNIRNTIKSNYGLLLTLAAGTVVFLIQWYPLFKMGFLTATGTNADVSSYALVAQHIEQHSFNEIGKISLDKFTTLPKQDVSGAYFFIALARHATRTQYYEVLIPALGAAQLMLTHALYKLLKTFVKLPTVLLALLSIFPQTTFMSRYVSGNYFLAQILATGAMVLLLGVFLEMKSFSSQKGIDSFRFLHWGVIPLIVLLLTYPHMAFVVPPLLVIIVFPSVPKVNKVAFIRSVSIVGFLSITLLFGKFTVAFDRMKDLALDSVNGWPLPGILPSQLLGVQWSALRTPSVRDVFFSVVLVVIFLCSLIINKTSTQFFPSVSVLFWTGITYVYFYFSSGPSYRQWKWITFFEPIVVVALLLPIFYTLIAKIGPQKYGPLVLSLVLSVFMVGNVARTFDYSSEITAWPLVVTKKISSLANEQDLKKISELNIKSGAYLGSMWPAYFVPSRSVNILDDSYFTATEPLKAPTLVSENFLVGPGVRFKTLDSGFKLIEFPSDNSTTIHGLSASVSLTEYSLETRPDVEIIITGKVRNAGKNSWFGSGLVKGSVNMGARVISKNGLRVNLEMARSELTMFPNYVSPGETRDFQLNIRFSEPGRYLLEITAVSEGLTWFSDLNTKFANYVEVNVY